MSLLKRNKQPARPTTIIGAVTRVMNSGAWRTTEHITAAASELLGYGIKEVSAGAAMRRLRTQGRTVLRRKRLKGFDYEFRLVRKGGK